MSRWLLLILLIPSIALADQDRPAPPQLDQFQEAFVAAYVTWKKNDNAIRREGTFERRASTLAALLGPDRSFKDWELEVEKIGLDKDGAAWLALRIPAGVRDLAASFHLVNTSPRTGADPDHLKFAKGSPLFEIARTLDRFDHVAVSGSFQKDAAMVLQEGGLKTFDSSDREAEERLTNSWFIVRITALKKLAD